MFLKIALTGGICSGKSTVAGLFEEKGIFIVDADHIAKILTHPGTEYFQRIIEHFGTGLLENEGLNRKKLKAIIFEHPKERRWLEDLLHPAIVERMQEVPSVASPYVIFVIPLLAESKPIPWIDRILVIDASEHLQRERLHSRDGLEEGLIEKILMSQKTREERLQIADDTIENNGDLAHLQAQVDRLHGFYRGLSADKGFPSGA